MLRGLAALALLGTGVWMVNRNKAQAAPAADGVIDRIADSLGIAPATRPAAPVRRPLPHGDIVALVAALAPDYGFAAADVLAIIEIESSFRPAAYRAEPQIGDGSYGLMQILYSTAKDRGYAGAPAGLFDPETNIRLGIAHLAWGRDYLARFGAVAEAQWVGAYNAGVGNVRKGYIPAGYVAKWRNARARWRALLGGG